MLDWRFGYTFISISKLINFNLIFILIQYYVAEGTYICVLWLTLSARSQKPFYTATECLGDAVVNGVGLGFNSSDMSSREMYKTKIRRNHTELVL